MQSTTKKRLLSAPEQSVKGESARGFAVVVEPRFAWISLRSDPEDLRLGEMSPGTGLENQRRNDELRADLSLVETETKREVCVTSISALGVAVVAALGLALRGCANSPEVG